MEDNGKTGFALEEALIIYFLKLYSFKKVKNVVVLDLLKLNLSIKRKFYGYFKYFKYYYSTRSSQS